MINLTNLNLTDLAYLTNGSYCITDEVYYVAVPSAGEADARLAMIVAAVAIPLSTVSVFLGYFVFQFIVGTAASLVSGIGLIYGLTSADVSCDLIKWTAPTGAVVGFGAGVLIARRAACIIGLLFGGAIPYLIFSIFPSLGVLDTGSAPNIKLLGFYVLPVWATVGCSALLFGILLCRFSGLVKILVTAAIGSYCAVAAVCLLIEPPENWVFAVAVCGSFVAGVAGQHLVKLYLRRVRVSPRGRYIEPTSSLTHIRA